MDLQELSLVTFEQLAGEAFAVRGGAGDPLEFTLVSATAVRLAAEPDG